MIKPSISKLNQTCYLPLLVSIAITAFFLLPAASKDLLIYETNDDTTIIALLSGKMGLAPTLNAIFISLPLGKVLAELYRIDGTIPWFGLFLYACLFIGFFLCCRIIFLATAKPLNRICYLSAITVLYIYTLYRLNFAAVSLYLWCMTVSSIALANLKREGAPKGCAGFGILLGISYLIRPDLLLIALPLSLPLMATFFIPGSHKRLCYVLFPLLLTIIISVVFDQSIRSTAEYRQFQDFNKVRSEFLDTARSSWTNRTPDALRKNGWSAEDYSVLHHWWLHDETIFNASSLRAFHKNNAAKTSLFSFENGYLRIKKVLPYVAILLIALVSIAFAEESAFLPADISTTTLYLIRIALLMSSCFLIALIFVRFPPRIAIPSFSHFLLTALLFRAHIMNGSISLRMPPVFLAVVALLMILIGYRCLDEITTFARTLIDDKKYRHAVFDEIRAKSPQEPVFISTNISSVLDRVNPLRESQDIPHYIRMPMGWLTGSPAYTAFLQKYGFGSRKTVVPEMVDNSRVVMYSWDSEQDPVEDYFPKFVVHLNQNYGKFFPNRRLGFRLVEDRRLKSNDGRLAGLVFFKIITMPQ